jgi:hypothetical protein
MEYIYTIYYRHMKKIILFALILCSISAQAQVNLGISQLTPVGFNDTLQSPGIDSFAVYVKNYGPSTFNDTLHVYTLFDSAGGTNYDTVGYNKSVNTIAIPANDSAQINLMPAFNFPLHGYNSSVVGVIVVWPFSKSSTTVESLKLKIAVIATSVKEVNIEELVKLFPNPVSEKLNIAIPLSSSVEEVTIIDLQGRIVASYKDTIVLNVEDLSPGMYTVDILSSTKKHNYIKIIKQK